MLRMNITTITSAPKETILSAVSRAVFSASLNNKIVKLDYRGIDCLVYPNETGAAVTSYIAKFNNVLKKFKF